MAETMSNEERLTAELAVYNLHKAVEHLNIAYGLMKELTLNLGWDTAFDKISEASMIIGEKALGIMDGIIIGARSLEHKNETTKENKNDHTRIPEESPLVRHLW